MLCVLAINIHLLLMVLIRLRLHFCHNLILQRVADSRIERPRQLAIETTSGQRCLESSEESPAEIVDQTGLVRLMVHQQPDEDDTETTTFKAGQSSDNRETVARHGHEMVERRPRHDRKMAK